jgi:hypothetical protein
MAAAASPMMQSQSTSTFKAISCSCACQQWLMAQVTGHIVLQKPTHGLSSKGCMPHTDCSCTAAHHTARTTTASSQLCSPGPNQYTMHPPNAVTVCLPGMHSSSRGFCSGAGFAVASNKHTRCRLFKAAPCSSLSHVTVKLQEVCKLIVLPISHPAYGPHPPCLQCPTHHEPKLKHSQHQCDCDCISMPQIYRAWTLTRQTQHPISTAQE